MSLGDTIPSDVLITAAELDIEGKKTPTWASS